ncbi:MAG: hypothetical protein AVDCRST_MAG30-3723 [uncultured Solirubrobacteraceae bacterium]|uniref:Uncharacterized protein n=1 Tax=uncultured Solirubrobacteraceae bacterium TaxID=1162706 RepID=A0A6J4TT47_9ACTN|nr:MAG: hypothetical protein AVDCRST_MAG30-3723 [uncultured Solirubrobacteraceae bacterium]
MTPPRLLPLLALAGALCAAQPAHAAVAPGRITFPIDQGAVQNDADVAGLSVGAALPDGRVVLAGTQRRNALVLVQLTRGGAFDPSFGSAGRTRIEIPTGEGPGGLEPAQVLIRPDGRVLVVATLPPASKYELPRLIVVGLGADGRLDQGFGDGGVARLPIQASCANCGPATLLSDGSLAVTGNTGRVPASIENDPNTKPEFRWVAARLTPDGRLDARFGQDGIATLPGDNGGGYGASALPGDAIALVGKDASGPKVARLAPDGSLDRGFNGGAPATPPLAQPFVFSVLGRADGSFDVLGSGEGVARIVRYTPEGEVDRAFSDRSIGQIPGGQGPSALLPTGDGGTIVAGFGTFLKPPLVVARLSADGVVVRRGEVDVPFGGGGASMFARRRVPRATPLAQNGFVGGRPIVRPDGSLMLPGAVGVHEATGEGTGIGIDQAAVAAFTPAFELDEAFGGPARQPVVSLRVARQRAATAVGTNRLALSMRVTAPGPGLALLQVRARGKTIARSTAPVYRAGTTTRRVFLTRTGRAMLRGARNLRVKAGMRFRDLVGTENAASARGRLR